MRCPAVDDWAPRAVQCELEQGHTGAHSALQGGLEWDDDPDDDFTEGELTGDYGQWDG